MNRTHPIALGSIRRALPLWVFVLVCSVLALLGIVVDIGTYGPITAWAAERVVVDPVEKAWGFHAEWREYGATSDSLLTVVSVVPGGAFERSGIRPGFAFAPRECGFGGPLLGGHHYQFVGDSPTVRVRMLAEPGPPGRARVYAIRRSVA